MESLFDLIKVCEEEEAKLQFESFDYDNAWELGSLMVEKAQKDNLAIVMAINLNDQKLFYYACKGTSALNENWVRRKENTVWFAKKSSLHFSYVMSANEETLESHGLIPEDYVSCGGGFPLIVKGEVVGNIIVSGLPHLKDHAFIVDSLTEYLN